MIGAAMAEAGVAGIGRLTLSRRERMVMVEPRGTGMALFTLRATDEVRSAQFASAAGHSTRVRIATAIKRLCGRQRSLLLPVGRRQKAEGAAHDRSGGCRCQVAKEGMNAAKRITLALLSARRLMGR